MAAPKNSSKTGKQSTKPRHQHKTSSTSSKVSKKAPSTTLHKTHKTPTSIRKPSTLSSTTATRLASLGLSSLGSSPSSTPTPTTSTPRITGSTKARDESLKTELDASLTDVLTMLQPRSKKMRASGPGGNVVWAGEDVDMDGSGSGPTGEALRVAVAEEERRKAVEERQASFEKAEQDMQSALDLLTNL
ncbi:hypothetical protein HDV00_000242 [Rhizophlyctis rosea]|nr:hypothetical protein HDV00_000242 [Rhizophlyctis rosea]